MTFQPRKSIGLGFLVLLFVMFAPAVVDWCRNTFRLPPGYGAEGDRRFNRRVPAAVRTAVDELSAGSEGDWVQERVEGGTWVYDLHLLKDGKRSVIHLALNGQVIRPATQVPEPEPIPAEGSD